MLAPGPLALVLGCLALFACDDAPQPNDQTATATEPTEPKRTGAAKGEHEAKRDAGADADAQPPEPRDPPPRLYARKYVSRVWSAPSVESAQLGYMRAGSVVTAKTAEPVGHERCYRGWYEIAETGGFVCDGREVTAFHGEQLPDVQPAQPDRSQPLPYVYARTTRSGTPMYKRLPTREEFMLHELGRLPDGGLVEPPEPADAAAADAGDGGDAAASGESEEEEEEQEPPPTLEELRGERGAFIRRTLQAGFYVSLDRELERDGRHYWRTLSSGHISAGRLETIEAGKFQGVDLTEGPHPEVAGADADAGTDAGADAGQGAGEKDAGAKDAGADAASQPAPAHDPPYHLPIGYVLSSKTPRYQRNARGVLRRLREEPGYHHVFEIVATERARGREFVRDPEGFLYDARLIRRIDRADPPEDVKEGERWLDIDLSNQSLVAYEGTVPVRATLISSGRVRGAPGSPFHHATPTGVYRILSKHTSATMDGDHAISGPYSLEDVPYVQFFQGALALHSAFWHNRFGRASSHGCINLPPIDALWLFDWTRPEVPAPWHAAYPVKGAEATLIRIRGETPPG